MNKEEFLKLLKFELQAKGVSGIDDIMTDYEEHFSHGLSKGKSEEEISKNLGSPLTLASAYKTDSMIREVKNTDKGFNMKLALKVVIRLLVLAPFNLIVLFIPGMIVFGLLVGGWGAAIGLGGASLGVLGFMPQAASLSLSVWAWIAGFSLSLTLLGVAVLLGMVMFMISKYLLIGLISYLQWNVKFVLEK